MVWRGRAWYVSSPARRQPFGHPRSWQCCIRGVGGERPVREGGRGSKTSGRRGDLYDGGRDCCQPGHAVFRWTPDYAPLDPFCASLSRPPFCLLLLLLVLRGRQHAPNLLPSAARVTSHPPPPSKPLPTLLAASSLHNLLSVCAASFSRPRLCSPRRRHACRGISGALLCAPMR